MNDDCIVECGVSAADVLLEIRASIGGELVWESELVLFSDFALL